jgi:ABC-type phosphate transport system substrate-binding protein
MAALFVGLTNTASATLTHYNLNSLGSDVTFCVSNAIDNAYNTKVAAKTGNKVYDTPPYLAQNVGCQTTPATYTVPADSRHAAITYNSSNPPPNGSTSGIQAFITDNGAGNIAFARSTNGRKSTYPANLEFWAYALDAMSWVHFTPGSNAPNNLTATQIHGILNCTYTNWNQVGGRSGLIKRYYPAIGSGTATFFSLLFNGGSNPVSTSTCPITFVPQNDATQVAAADRTNAFLPYSFANFYSQTHQTGGEANLAAGTFIGQINGVGPSTNTLKESAAFINISGDACTSAPVAGTFCATRYVYNVTWQMLPAPYYAAVIDLIGVPISGTPGANSVCAPVTPGSTSSRYNTTLRSYGFKPLGKNTTAQSTSSDPVPGTSFCRQF